MPTYAVIKEGKVCRTSAAKDVDTAIRYLKLGPKEELFVNVILRLNHHKQRTVYEFPHQMEVNGETITLHVNYRWADCSEGADETSTLPNFEPKIEAVWWGNINLIEALKEEFLSEIVLAAYKHHALLGT